MWKKQVRRLLFLFLDYTPLVFFLYLVLDTDIENCIIARYELYKEPELIYGDSNERKLEIRFMNTKIWKTFIYTEKGLQTKDERNLVVRWQNKTCYIFSFEDQKLAAF